MLALTQGIGAPGSARMRSRLRAAVALAILLTALPSAARAADPITPLRDVHRGLHCTALTVVQGTTISSFDVDVLDVVAAADGEGPRILVHVSGPAVDATGVAEGMSGSPVYCPDANGRTGNAGAISESVGQYGGDVALVTPIEQMLGSPAVPPSSVRTAPVLLRDARPLASPLVVAGLAPSLAPLLQQVAQSQRRAIIEAPAGPLGAFPPQPLVPGASLSVLLAHGALDVGAVGTVTYRDGSTLYGFGHPLEGEGRRSLPLGDAYVFTVVNNPLNVGPIASYKLAAPGHVLGTLTNDALNAVVGNVGAAPHTVPVVVTVRDRDRHRTTQERTDVADEADVGNPEGTSVVSAVAPLAMAQAVADAFDGAPADETGQLCLHVHLRELPHRPLRFCKRYVVGGGGGGSPALATVMGDDASVALAAIDAARFARLHVTEVTAAVTIQRGLRLGTILDAAAPLTVRPGHTTRVALRVRVVHGPLRTIRFRLLIPRDAPSGVHLLRLSGTSMDGGDGGGGPLGLLFSIFSIGGDGSGDGPPPAQSMSDVQDAFSAIAGYDGVTARLGGERWNAYRSPQLRLDGDAMLIVRVVRGRHGRGHGRSRVTTGPIVAPPQSVPVAPPGA